MHLRELRTQISDYAERTAALHEQRRARLDGLLAALRGVADADAPQALGARFDVGESPAAAFPFGDEPRAFALIAADGSQIMPDRHKPVVFAYVQAAAACIVYGCADVPAAQRAAEEIQRDVRSRLLSELDLPIGENANPAAEVSNLRDVLEIQLLADACARFAALGVRPIVVADGSIVPFALLNERTLANPAQTDKLLRPIVAALNAMRAADAIVVGYIDRPNSASVAQACALFALPADARNDEDAARAAAAGVEGIYDRHILEGTLPPGCRSALFDPGWKVNEPKHLGVHAMRACYANFGDGASARAIIARLETPLWCADAARLAAVTGVLRRHAALDPDGYPFILKAAHELAVVGRDDQREIEAALEQELLARGMRPRYSPKQAAKNRE
jgi:hypothetical protein